MLPKFDPKTGEHVDFTPSGECHWVQIALMIASAVISAYAAAQQGQARKQAMDYQAAVARQRAKREREVALANEGALRKKNQGLMEARRARILGVETGSGSPLASEENFAKDIELAALRTRAGGFAIATRLEQSAELSAFQGRSAQSAGYFRGGALLVGGAGKVYGRGLKMGYWK
jgi:hypothetical protein